MNCAMYYSTDGGKTYLAGPTIKDTAAVSNSANFRPTDSNTYVDLKKVEEHSWVYFKSVLIVQPTPVVSYIGLGTAKWTEPMFTMVEKYYDAAGNEVDAGSPDAVRHETHYYDYQGHEVTEEEATNAKPIAPTQASYANAYRSNYEFPSNSGFTTDYFYQRQYSYSYSAGFDDLSQSIVSTSGCSEKYPIENLIDGNPDTICNSSGLVTPEAPWDVVVDLGKVIEANRFELTGYKFNNANNKNQTPNSITLYLGETLDAMKEVASFDNGAVNNITLAFNFESTRFRYYKLVVRKTVEGRYVSINKIVFTNNISGGHQFSPDEDSFAFTGTWNVQQAYSTFGHVYVGSTGAEMSFKFNGTRLALFSSALHGKNFEVYIDGKKVDSIDMSAAEIEKGLSFLSDKLNNTTHTVRIKCTGKANIDSVVIFD